MNLTNFSIEEEATIVWASQAGKQNNGQKVSMRMTPMTPKTRTQNQTGNACEKQICVCAVFLAMPWNSLFLSIELHRLHAVRKLKYMHVCLYLGLAMAMKTSQRAEK